MRFENLTDEQILEAIRHPDDRRGNTDIHTVEGCLLLNNNYRWYYGLARAFQPETICEIGVRFGYSLYALAAGAGNRPFVTGYDNESYKPGSIDWATKHLEPICQAVNIHKFNSQAATRLPLAETEQYDCFSVDGDHTAAGARHDLDLAWQYTGELSQILVDDIDYAGVDGRINLRPVVQEFCRDKGVDFLYLPTTRGLAVIIKR